MRVDQLPVSVALADLTAAADRLGLLRLEFVATDLVEGERLEPREQGIPVAAALGILDQLGRRGIERVEPALKPLREVLGRTVTEERRVLDHHAERLLAPARRRLGLADRRRQVLQVEEGRVQGGLASGDQPAQALARARRLRVEQATALERDHEEHPEHEQARRLAQLGELELVARLLAGRLLEQRHRLFERTAKLGAEAVDVALAIEGRDAGGLLGGGGGSLEKVAVAAVKLLDLAEQGLVLASEALELIPG